MILYLDASALVKRYVSERGTAEVGRIITQADGVGTSLISRAEISAALAKAVRVKLLTRNDATKALRVFRAQWNDLARLQLTETLIAQADALAWEHSLRGYDAVHLASALFWQEMIGEPLTLATYDRQLWEAARQLRLEVFPMELLPSTP